MIIGEEDGIVNMKKNKKILTFSDPFLIFKPTSYIRNQLGGLIYERRRERMKKFLKSRKRWIAFFLAFLLVATTCITSSDAFLWATEDGTTETEQADNGHTEKVVELDMGDEEAEPEKVEGETDTEGTEKVEGETDTEGTETVEGEEQKTVAKEADEKDPDKKPVDEEQSADTDPEQKTEETTYSYAIYYYYGDIEDEGARVEKNDGTLGDTILASEDVENEVVHNEKNYVLDRIENENGTVTENAEQNIVKVYYIQNTSESDNEEPNTDAEEQDPIKDDVTTAEEEETEAEEEGIQTLEAILEEEEVAYYTVTFQYADPSKEKAVYETLVTQTVKANDKVEIPNDPPEYEGYSFAGWDGVTADTVVTGDMTVTARYNKIGKYTVTINYLYSDGITVAAQPYVAEVKAGEEFHETIKSPKIDGFEADQKEVTVNVTDDKDFVTNVIYSGGEVEYTVVHKLEGISGEIADQTADTETLTGQLGTMTQAEAKHYEGFTAGKVNNYILGANGNQSITIVYTRNLYTLSYNTGDNGSYIMPETLKYGEKIDYPTGNAVTKPGYEFAGWDFNEPTMPAHNVIATAKWKEATTAKYTVVYWQEKVPGTYEGDALQYDYKESVVKGPVKVGSTATYDQKNYPGFELDSSKSNVKVEVAADGSTVKNVYYNRKEYTISFYKVKWQGGLIFGKYVKGEEYKEYKITAKYGEDISKQWEKASESKGWGPNLDDNVQYTLFANMPAENLEMYEKSEMGTGRYIKYYVEGLDGRNKEYASFSCSSGTSLTDEDEQPIEGFTFKNRTDLNLYYTRNSYKLEFANCKASTIEVKYEDTISDKLPSNPVPKDGIDSDYVFAGWYYSPAYTTEIESGDKMPAHNVQVYAKWEKPKYNVTLHYNVDGKENDVVTKEKGYTISPEALNGYMEGVTKENHEPLGWYMDAACTKPFTEGMQVRNNMDLYLGWKQVSGTFSYTVECRYEDEEKPFKTETKSGDVNTTVTETAPAVEDGFAIITSKSLNLSEDGLTIEFVYKKVATWSYIVKYVDEDGTELLPKATRTTNKNVVTENFVPVANYTVINSQATLNKEANKKEIVFTYKPCLKNSYTVKYLLEKADGSGYEVKETVNGEGFIGWSVTADEKSYDGFECITSERERTITIRKNGNNVIEVKYNRIRVEYTVRHLDKDTSESIADAETHTARYGQTITETGHKKDIVGYTYDSKYPVDGLVIEKDSARNVLILYYAPIPDKLVYDGNSATGGNVAPTEGRVGQNVKTAANGYTRTGYTFAGWNTAADGTGTTYTAGSDYTLTEGEDILYAQWKPNTDTAYKVNHYLQDVSGSGYTLKESEDKTGTTAEMTQAEAKTYAGFTAQSFEQETIKADGTTEVNIYYNRTLHSVTYTDGVEGEEVFEDQTTPDVRYGAPTPGFDGEPERTGYNFTGWKPEVSKTVTEDAVYTATWSPKSNTGYTVKHYLQNVEGDEYSLDDTEHKEGTTGQSTAAEAKTYTGFTAQSFTQKTIAANGTTVIEIRYDRTLHSVTYTDGVEGEEVFEDQTTPDVRYGASTPGFTGTPDRIGYTFVGWKPGVDLTVTKDAVYTAIWNARTDTKYTIKYYYQENGSYSEENAEVRELTGTTGAKVVAEKTTTKSGYVYDASAGNVLEGTIAGDGSTVLKVYFKQQFMVTYAPGAHGTFTVQETKNLDYNAATPAAPEEEALTHNLGYTFAGWSPEIAEKVTENATYVAQWTANTDTLYRVQYHYQNPSNGIYSDETPVERHGTTDTTVRLRPEDLVPSSDKQSELESGKYDVYDEADTRNKVSGNVEGDGSLTLHVYFPLVYTVSGTIDHGTVTEGNQNVRYAAASSAMVFTADKNYVITSITVNGEAQIVADNQITYTYPRQEDVRSDVEVNVTTETMNPHLKLTKIRTNNPAENGKYGIGEEITYTITAANIGNLTLRDVVVKDELVGGEWTIPELKPGESEEYNVSYEVTEADVKEGHVLNEVTAEVGDLGPDYPDPKVDDGDVDAPVDTPQPSLYVEKIAKDNGPDKTYAEGEEVTYTIRVINNGNVTIKDIKAIDPLTGMEWDVGTLVPGDKAIPLIRKPSKEKDTKYTVKPDDILAGKVVNTVNVTGTDPDGNLVEADATETITTDAIDATYSVTKEITSSPRADGTYHAGDMLTYRITVTSEANVTLENIEVGDQLSNVAASGAVRFTTLGGISADDTDALEAAGITLNDDNTVTIRSLAPGGNVDLNCEYEVTKADAALNTQLEVTDPLNAGIKNTATASADTVEPTDPGKNPVDPGEETGETDPAPTEDRYTLIIQYQYADGTTAAATHVDYLLEGDTYAVTSPTIEGYNSSYVAVTGTMPNRDVVVTVVYTAPTTPGGGGGGTTPTPPTPPTPDGPNPIVVPDIPVPAAPGAVQVVIPTELVPVGDEEVPLQGAQIDVDEDGNVTVTPIDEEEIPLAGGENDDHACCILHFLLMLAALIIYSFYTDSMKKHQKKLAELKDELAGETLKKQLGITDDRQARM